jgi:hypothetical protein
MLKNITPSALGALTEEELREIYDAVSTEMEHRQIFDNLEECFGSDEEQHAFLNSAVLLNFLVHAFPGNADVKKAFRGVKWSVKNITPTMMVLVWNAVASTWDSAWSPGSEDVIYITFRNGGLVRWNSYTSQLHILNRGT